MTIYEIEKYLALRKYRNDSGDIVTFTYFSHGTTCGAITTLFSDLTQLSGKYSLRQDNDNIYFIIGEDEYIFVLKEIDDKRIIEFDLVTKNTVANSFTFITN